VALWGALLEAGWPNATPEDRYALHQECLFRHFGWFMVMHDKYNEIYSLFHTLQEITDENIRDFDASV
jgi:hypothetical protein